MTSHPKLPTRVPPEVAPQIDLLLKLLDDADIHRAGLPTDLLEEAAALPEDRACAQLAAALSVLPTDKRDLMRVSLRFLADLVRRIEGT